MSNYPWCSLTPRDNISDIETRWLECQFWWRLSFTVNQFLDLKKNTAVLFWPQFPFFTILFLPRRWSVSVMSLMSTIHRAQCLGVRCFSSSSRCFSFSSSHLVLFQFPPLPSVCQPPTVPSTKMSHPRVLCPDNDIVRQLQRYEHLIDPNSGWVWILKDGSVLQIDNLQHPSMVQVAAWPTHKDSWDFDKQCTPSKASILLWTWISWAWLLRDGIKTIHLAILALVFLVSVNFALLWLHLFVSKLSTGMTAHSFVPQIIKQL